MDIAGARKLLDSWDLRSERFDARRIDEVAKKIQFWLTKEAFLWHDNQAIFLESVKECMEMTSMCFNFRTGYKDVIKVNKYSFKTSHNCIHKSLRGLAGIPQTKWHVDKFREAKRSQYSCFTDVMHRDLMILIKSIFWKISVPAKTEGKSWNCGMWYLSEIAFTFKQRWSPHGHHSLEDFGMVWTGEAQGLEDGWRITMSIMQWNLCRAVQS